MKLLFLWLTISSLVAFFWTTWFPSMPDPFSAAVNAVVLKWLIVVTMFAIGWMLPRDEIRQVASRWPMVLAGSALQYATMPLLAYLCGRMFGLTGDHLIGIVMVGSVPGAMASNVLTLLARGNASYSVSLTTLSTLLSPLAVPLVLRVFLSTSVPMPNSFFIHVSRDLLLTVVLPVVTGHIFGRLSPKWERHAQRIGSTIANLAILWIIAAVVGQNRDKIGAGSRGLIVGVVDAQHTGLSVWLRRGIRDASSGADATCLDIGDRHAERRAGSRAGRQFLWRSFCSRHCSGHLHFRLHVDRYDPSSNLVSCGDGYATVFRRV